MGSGADQEPSRRTSQGPEVVVSQSHREVRGLYGKTPAARRSTTGQIVSELLRKALAPARQGRIRNGVPLLPALPRGSGPLTMAAVNRLRDD